MGNVITLDIMTLYSEKFYTSTGTWPQSSAESFSPGILDTTLVLGYEDWMIVEQLAYVSFNFGLYMLKAITR